MVDFIEIYDRALDPSLCNAIIQSFEASDKVHRGRTGQALDITKKDSYDLMITGYKEWQTLESQVMNVTFNYLKIYLRKYLFALVGAVSTGLIEPQTNQVVTLNADNFERLGEPHLDAIIQKVYRRDVLKIQKYIKGSGGYHHWHSEIYPDPHSPAEETLHRVLYFQYYLNTIESGGETEFFYQNLKIKPEQGRLVIAPAGFTHTHKGHIPQSDHKYIITSWILFQPAETLYGVQRRSPSASSGS
ncbi:MAG: 2OG-Fe(II) oxygenase [Desertifilum sp. SIO1I2]|nr:2OG-Fe(II) oxygenase [Desertifilum sp. SIO1I2]